MNDESSLLERLMEYSESKAYPFHMPGHKRHRSEELGTEFPNPFKIDITEIEGFDNLHHAEGILKESMDRASAIYGSDKTYYLVNGSSGGILSAISAAVPFGGTLLMSRNCHKSVYHGVILNHLKAVYTYPQIIPKFAVQGGLSPENIEILLKKYGDIDAVLIVSPTYDGIVSDIRAIAGIVHRFGIPLIVDEAHGAHFSYGSLFPVSALNLGADVVIQSLHKTLPSLTQTALLHVKEGYVDVERLERYLSMYQTSSPSYVFMAAMDNCIRQMDRYGKEIIDRFAIGLENFRHSLGNLKYLKLLDRDLVGSFDIFDMDISKILVSCRNTGFSGVEFDRILRETYGLEMEMCTADSVTAITTLADQQEGLSRLSKALLEMDQQCREKGMYLHQRDQQTELLETASLRLWEGMDKGKETVSLEMSEGYQSGEFVYLYPPGIPVLAPGERITGEILEQILSYRAIGLPVQGMTDRTLKTLRVIRN